MRKALGEAVFAWTRMSNAGPDGYAIVAYHSIADVAGSDVETITRVDFERQILWLVEHRFEFLTISDLVARLQRDPGPRPVMAVTFDDGYLDNYTNALPILRRHSIPATIYVATAYLGDLSTWNPANYIGHRPMLSRDHLRALGEAGIELASHSHTHTDLTRLGEAAITEELRRSAEILHAISERPITAFAPPYSRTNAVVTAAAARQGYTSQVNGGRFALNRPGTSPYDLRRITIARTDSLREFVKKVSGCYNWLRFWDR